MTARRQLASRARRRIRAESEAGRFTVDRAEHRGRGPLRRCLQHRRPRRPARLLDPNVVGDFERRVRCCCSTSCRAQRPSPAGSATLNGPASFTVDEVNGQPGVVARIGNTGWSALFEVAAGRITVLGSATRASWVTCNPEPGDCCSGRAMGHRGAVTTPTAFGPDCSTSSAGQGRHRVHLAEHHGAGGGHRRGRDLRPGGGPRADEDRVAARCLRGRADRRSASLRALQRRSRGGGRAHAVPDLGHRCSTTSTAVAWRPHRSPIR